MIEIKRIKDGDPLEFGVTVRDANGATHHQVTIARKTYEKLRGGVHTPEHVLEAARALLQCLEDNPVLARAAIVGSHAAAACSPAGPGFFAERFAIFLEEGFRYESGLERPPEICLQGITMTVLELGYQLIRKQQSEHLTGRLGHVGFVALAPFLAADQTNAFLREHIPPGAC